MLERLEKLIVSKALGPEAFKQFESGEISKKHLETVLPEILRLSEVYNFPEKKQATRLSSKISVEAYMLYFLPVNYFKILWLLEKINLNKEQVYKVLDFGCGPGSASLAAIEYFGEKTEINLFDISNNASQCAKELISDFSPQTVCKISDKDWNKNKFDLIIAANSINEIRAGNKDALLAELSGALSENGVLLILEPALKSKTRDAMEVRNKLLDINPGFSMLYPCTHENSCPMLAESDKDWCHGSISWDGSPLIRQFDKLTGFNKHRLKYSAFIFKNAKFETEGYRVVDIPQKNKTGYSAKLCGENLYSLVTLARRDRNDKNRIFEKADLHDRVLISEDFSGSITKETEIRLT